MGGLKPGGRSNVISCLLFLESCFSVPTSTFTLMLFFSDIMSLGKPDGKFLIGLQSALQHIAYRSILQSRSSPIIVRIMLSNYPAKPCDCTEVLETLTKNLPENSNIQIWVGAWRRGLSWNHAKLIAVDGKYLHTGGHNVRCTLFFHTSDNMCPNISFRYHSKSYGKTLILRKILSMICQLRWKARLLWMGITLRISSGSLSKSNKAPGWVVLLINCQMLFLWQREHG